MIYGKVKQSISDAETSLMLTCSHCDTQYSKWQGRCNECGKWGSIEEEKVTSFAQKPTNKQKRGIVVAPLVNLSSASAEIATHISTNITELDRVLCGGIVRGSVTLLAGEPGIGKSTLVAQLASSFQHSISKTYYVSGEESESQVAMRFSRLGIDASKIAFSNVTQIGSIITTAEDLKPRLLIIDSIQTMIASEIDNLPGTPTAVRAATAELIGFAKTQNIPVLLIGQVTKDGIVAGPKTLEHLVDTVLTLEGDTQSPYRILRAGKNRFGNTDEVGIFEMTEKGMQAVLNPSARFLEDRAHTSGSAVTCIIEGTRPILVEVQALVEKSVFTNPIRRTSGFDGTRLQMLLAIINKRTKIKIACDDVYVNIVGGIKIKEHAADLAVCAAIISCTQDKAIASDTMICGELGLGGEIRTVPFLEKRIKEAQRLGFSKIISPKSIKNIKDFVF